MVGSRVAVGVAVVMGHGHVVQPVVLRRQRPRVRQTVGLVGEAVRGAEALGGADGAGPLAGVDVRVQGAVSLEAVLFGSGGDGEETEDMKERFGQPEEEMKRCILHYCTQASFNFCYRVKNALVYIFKYILFDIKVYVLFLF